VAFANPHFCSPKILGMMLDMANLSREATTRLGRAVEERRRDLGMTQLEVWQAGGPSNSTMTAIENGIQETFTPSTLRKLDIGLKWESGTAAAVLRGDADPAPTRPAEPIVDRGRSLTADEVIAAQSDARLAREMQRRGWRVIPADEPQGWHDRPDAPPI
jgi:DNA-binding XRE family transcriptional regulator